MRLDCSAAYYLLTATELRDTYGYHIIFSTGSDRFKQVVQAYLQLENGINLGGGKYEEKFTQENP